MNEKQIAELNYKLDVLIYYLFVNGFISNEDYEQIQSELKM